MKRFLLLISLIAVTTAAFFVQELQGQALPRLAVAAFTTNVSTEKARQDVVTVRDIVESEMTMTGRYTMVTRNEIDQLLLNQSIQTSEISSAENIAKLRLTTIKYIVTGSVNATDNDYSVIVRVLDVANGVYSHMDRGLIGSGSRDLDTGLNALMKRFIAGMVTGEGGSIIRADSAEAQFTGISIEVRTREGGELFFQGERVASLWDNDTHTIPIERPGTYSLRLEQVNGAVKITSVSVTTRGVTRVDFSTILPDLRNVRSANVSRERITLLWDSAGSGLSYKVYYSTQNNPSNAESKVVNTTSIDFTNLALGTTYYFWVSVVQGQREGDRSPVLTVRTLSYNIGDTGPAGGLIFYDKGNSSDGWRFLEAAPASTEFRAQWGAYQRDVSGTGTAVGTGKRNTELIINHLRQTGETGRAAQLCASLNFGGFNDWFLPSKDELDLMYKNLAQRGLGGFRTVSDTTNWTHIYWSSSQFSTVYALYQIFSNGSQDVNFKTSTYSVRAVRAFNP